MDEAELGDDRPRESRTGYTGFLPIAVLTRLKNSDNHRQSNSIRSIGHVGIGLQRHDVPRGREPHPVGVQHDPRLAAGVDGVGDVQVVREALREVLPRMHGGVLGDVGLLPAFGSAELVVPGDRVGVTGPLVAEQCAAVVEVLVCTRAGFDQYVLVVVAHLVAEVAEHRAVRLAEPNPQRLAVVIERFDEIDGDDASGVADDHLLAVAVARQQIEGQATVATPEGIDGQPDIGELVDHPPQGPRGRHQLLARHRVVGVGFPADRRVGQAAAALVGRLFFGGQPVAAQRLGLGAPDPSLAVDGRRRRRRPASSTSSAGEGRASVWQLRAAGDSNAAKPLHTGQANARTSHMVSRCKCY